MSRPRHYGIITANFTNRENMACLQSNWRPFKPLAVAAIFKKHVRKRDILTARQVHDRQNPHCWKPQVKSLGFFNMCTHKEKKGMEVILKIKRNLKDVSTFLMKQDETSV